MAINIHKDFLQKEEIEKLKKEMLSSFFPWHLAEVTWDNEYDQTHYQNSQLTHYFHDGFRPRSDHIELLGPLLEKINFKGLNRIKANLLMRTDKKIIHKMHTDVSVICTTGIFYLNTNNGETIFENGERVKSVENTFITFPSNLKHTGTTNTCNASCRVVLNFNYF